MASPLTGPRCTGFFFGPAPAGNPQINRAEAISIDQGIGVRSFHGAATFAPGETVKWSKRGMLARELKP